MYNSLNRVLTHHCAANNIPMVSVSHTMYIAWALFVVFLPFLLSLVFSKGF